MNFNLLKKLLFLSIMLTTSIIFAQTVTGTVTGDDGPLPGVNVIEKGTTNGVITDFDGKYSIDVGADAVLEFSFIGYATQEVVVNGRSVIDVKLVEDTQALDEVVVIGYGQTTKRDATGAVDAISSKDFDLVGAASPAQLLRGKVAGVQVASSSGEPGAGVNIRVRGSASLRAGSNPLIVIDGVPLDGGNISPQGNNVFGNSAPKNPLNFINQNDIESINVLKDASATAIYGSRGSNGVILITTKRGTTSEPTVTLNSSVGISTLSRNIDLLSPAEFAAASPSNDLGGRNYDWKDAILQDGVVFNTDIALTQRTEKSNTRISFGVSTQEGIVKQTGLDKYTASLNNSSRYFNDKLKIDAKVLVTALKDKTEAFAGDAGFTGDLISAAMRWNPTRPLRDSNGNFTFVDNQANLNPVELLNAYTDKTNTTRIVGNIAATLKITEKLEYKFSFGVDRSTSERVNQLLPSFDFQNTTVANPDNGQDERGSANIIESNAFAKIFEHTLTYTDSFSDDFNFDALLGYSYYDYDFDGSSLSAKGFGDGQTNLIDNIEGGVANQFRASSFRSSYEIQSFFGRINGNYKKLLFTATLRADGSTRFGGNNQYGYFPSAALGYKIFENNDGRVNNLKVRLNWGITGNQEFSNTASLGVQEFTSGGVNTVTNRNEDLQWEEKTSYGVGVDFGLFNDKLSGSVDYFYSETENLLFTTTLEATQPSPGVRRFINLPGKLENSGVELALNYDVIKREDLTWTVSGNVSYLDNELKAGIFEPTGFINGQGLSGAFSEVLANGLPLFNFFLLDFQGFDANGNNLFIGADGLPSSDGSAVPRIIDASPLPDFTFGFNSNVSYKNWDFSVSFYGQAGNYVYNNTANALFFAGALNGGTNVTRDVTNSNEAVGNANAASTRFLEKADFLRLSNLNVGYNFNQHFLDWAHLKSAKIYASGENLFVITGYSGFDPEVDSSTSFGGVSQFGIDYLSFPRATTITLGLNVSF